MTMISLTEKQLIQIAHEYFAKGPTLLGKELGVSPQVVSNAVSKLRKLGVKITHRNKTPIFRIAAKELLKEQNA